MTRAVLVAALTGIAYAQLPDTPGVIEAALSPDGTAVAYVRADSGSRQHRLWRTSFAGGEPLALTAAEGYISQLRWSPAGDRLVYSWRETPGAPGRPRQVASTGGPPQTLSDVDAVAPTLSVPLRPELAPPAGTKAVFITRASDGKVSIVLANANGTWIDLVETGTGIRTTVMRPGTATILSAPSWSADASRFAVVAAAAGEGPEVFAGSVPEIPSNRADWVGARPPTVRQITFAAGPR